MRLIPFVAISFGLLSATYIGRFLADEVDDKLANVHPHHLVIQGMRIDGKLCKPIVVDTERLTLDLRVMVREC